jgi:hypothetical protein
MPVPDATRQTLYWPPSQTLLTRISVAAVATLSAILTFIGLSSGGYANTYYAAAVLTRASTPSTTALPPG